VNSEKSTSGFVTRLEILIGDEKPYPWASRLGISQATFNRIWKEGWIPKGETLLLIAEKTGCSLDWLLTGKGSMKPGSVVKDVDLIREGLHPKYTAVTTNYDKELTEIIEILKNDLPDAKKFVLKVLRGKKEIKEGLKGLGLNGDIDEDE
jgi:transcriptional regulator with XRE-family HTH domain